MGNYIPNYLVFKAREAGTFTLSIGSGVPTTTLQSISYSLNGKTWVTTPNIDNEAVTITTPTVQSGDKVYWKGSCVAMASNYTANNYSTFSATGLFDVEGNIASLQYGDDFIEHQYDRHPGPFAFLRLFYQNKKIVSAYNLILPSKEIRSRAYQNMFTGCTSLVSSPDILYENAFTSNNDYYAMYEMFSGCSSLETVHDMHVVTFSQYGNGTCWRMFFNCTSLKHAPALPTLELKASCYREMFSGCTNLTSIKMMATDISAATCLAGWVKNVNSQGVFYKNPAATWENTYGESAIPANFTVITE